MFFLPRFPPVGENRRKTRLLTWNRLQRSHSRERVSDVRESFRRWRCVSLQTGQVVISGRHMGSLERLETGPGSVSAGRSGTR